MVLLWCFLAQFRTIFPMFIAKHHRAARTLLPLAFFGMLVSLLIVSESYGVSHASVITVQGGKTILPDGTEAPAQLPRCDKNSDCPLPTTYCGPSGKCTELINPVCDCGQPQVLRCYDENEKARFTFCKNGCIAIDDGAVCQ